MNSYTNASVDAATADRIANRVPGNAQALLAMTVAFSALTAGASMALNLPHSGLMMRRNDQAAFDLFK
jgi:modulator of FtsH protease